MTITAAITSGYRPIRAVRECAVLMVSPSWQTCMVMLTREEQAAQYIAVARAKQWAIETFGDGRRLDGDAMRPLLALHVRAAGARWVETRA